MVIRYAKTRRDLVSVIDDARIMRIFTLALEHAKERVDRRLFPIGFTHILRAIITAANDAGLKGEDYTTYSCRHGCALHLYMRGFKVECIALRGRWASQSLMKRYLDSGKSKLLRLNLMPAASNIMTDNIAMFNAHYRVQGGEAEYVVASATGRDAPSFN